VRKVSPDGTIATVPGATGFNFVLGIAIGANGKLYVTDLSHRIYLIQNGARSVFAGNGSNQLSGDGGPALLAGMDVNGMIVDPIGNLIVADYGNNAIRKIDTKGIITTLVQTYAPYSVTLGAKGNLIFTNAYQNFVSFAGADGKPQFFAGTGASTYSGDGGPATKATLKFPIGVVSDASGNTFIADTFNHVIRKVDANGVISTIAGPAKLPSLPVPALTQTLGVDAGVAADASNNLYFGDSDAHVVWRLSPDGLVKVFAGNGLLLPYQGGSGPATSISIDPAGLATDASGNLYVSSFSYGRVLRITPDGTASLFAGSGNSSNADNVPATTANLSGPLGLAADGKGNVYIAEREANRVRKVASNGIITTFAGNGKADLTGDGGKATDASVYSPVGVAERNGIVYIVECDGNHVGEITDHRVRQVTPDGLIHTIAGTGASGYSTDGVPAISANLDTIYSPAIDAAGNVYFVEFNSGRVRYIAPDGKLQTYAGALSKNNFSGDGGPATAAGLNHPKAIAFDGAGNLYIADTDNHRIRKVLANRPSFNVDTVALSFSAKAGGAPDAPQTLSVTAAVPGVPFTVTSSAAWLQSSVSNGSTPRQVTVIADPATLSPGPYQATLRFDANLGLPASQTVAVTFTVDAGAPPKLTTDQSALTFTLPRGGGKTTRALIVSNDGGGSFTVTTSATTRTGGPWLSVSPLSGTVTPRQPLVLSVVANVQNLTPGTYSGQIALNGGSAGTLTIPVILTVSALDQALELTQSGLSFTAVSGGGLAPPQTFGIKNIGNGTLDWTTSPFTTDGASWLSVGPTSGTSNAGAASPLASVSVNHAGLAPNRYYGLARVNSPQAANSPQVVTIHLDVLPSGSDPGAVIQPAELVFTSTGAQEVLVYNLTASSISFRGAVTSSAFTLRPYDGYIDPGIPFRLLIQPQVSTLSSAAGALSLQFANGQVRSIPLRIQAGAVSSTAAPERAATGCSPSELLPAFSLVGQSALNVPNGWPNGISVTVQDDCKRPITSGTVMLSFSNGDAPVPLSSVGDGTWQGTWRVGHAAPSVTLTATANEPQTSLSGVTDYAVAPNNVYDPPVFSREGVVSTSNPVANQPLTPGGVFSIYGSKLSSSSSQLAPLGALPTSLADTSVLINGRLAPLYFVSDTQVNGIVPWETPTDTQHQILVLRGPAISDPVRVSVAQAQPAFYLYSQPNASQQGLFLVVRPDVANPFLNTPSAPAKAGDTLVIYCLGLGVVTNQPQSGAVSPTNPLAQSPTLPTLRIGNRTVNVSFSGLAPQYVGLYQVQATLPQGLDTGPSVPATLEIAGQLSAAATIALQ
jgi:uncharacterized protein (TIGR03437 family)